jgi:dihydroorotate dehydrogenase (NAD+) catalytic subunit
VIDDESSIVERFRIAMSVLQSALKRLRTTALARLGIKSPFTIPSVIVTTTPAVLARIACDVPDIGFLTTKTLSLEPRAGYREPILHEYFPGCFVNAVGLANPGAEAFLKAMRPLLPLHNRKPLVVSIMGTGPDEFLECAKVLDPVADAFELNLSCPHVKGAGQAIGSDPEAVQTIIRLLKGQVGKPIIAKLSPNLGDIPGMARLCRDAGADALTLINTVGPGIATDDEGNPILSNVTGGLSGAGVLPLGIRAVREAAAAVDIPINACGGISSAKDVVAHLNAGAALFGIGSALAGMNTEKIAQYFSQLVADLDGNTETAKSSKGASIGTCTAYVRTRVLENRPMGDSMFRLRLESGPECKPGQFYFLRLPEVGEKPFSPAQANPPIYLVREVGPFTRALKNLSRGDWLYMRGPYGKGFPDPRRSKRRLVLIGGGTGLAPITMATSGWRELVVRSFAGFSRPVEEWFRKDLLETLPQCRIVVDREGQPGEVVRALEEDLHAHPEVYRGSSVFLCGPAPMMDAAVSVLREIVPSRRIYLGREDIMRCGVGICGSCGTRSGLRSCVDGPVMPANLT